MSTPIKILITGSSGYVAHFIASHFASKGIPTVGLDLKPHPVVPDMPHFTFLACDIRDKVALKAILAKEQPSHVIHLAYLMDPQHDTKFEYAVDVDGSRNILQATDETPSVKQFLLFSSISIYGANLDNPESIDEETPLRPNDFNYAVNKQKVEDYCNTFEKRSDLKLVIVRMATAVGPSYFKPGGIVSSFTRSPFGLLVDDIDGKVAFIHEEDIKALIEKLIHDPAVEGTFNLCSDTVAISELAKLQNKTLIVFPYWLLRGIAWLVWNLHIANFTPAMARVMTYSIVPSPKKLLDRYHYHLKYTAKEAFVDAVNQRKKLGRL